MKIFCKITYADNYAVAAGLATAVDTGYTIANTALYMMLLFALASAPWAQAYGANKGTAPPCGTPSKASSSRTTSQRRRASRRRSST